MPSGPTCGDGSVWGDQWQHGVRRERLRDRAGNRSHSCEQVPTCLPPYCISVTNYPSFVLQSDRPHLDIASRTSRRSGRLEERAKGGDPHTRRQHSHLSNTHSSEMTRPCRRFESNNSSNTSDRLSSSTHRCEKYYHETANRPFCRFSQDQ